MSETSLEQVFIPVTIIGSDGDSVLIEWHDGEYPCRGFLPQVAIVDDRCSIADLDSAVPYGIRWEDHVDLKSLTYALVSALYKSDIWTLHDLKQRDRRLIRIATDTVGKHIWAIAQREDHNDGT